MSPRAFLLEQHMLAVAKRLRRRAMLGVFDGRAASGTLYIPACRHDDAPTATRLIFTRDVGHHSSGWMKNPDFERCWHLSLSPIPRIIVPGTEQLAELDDRTRSAWVRAFFGADARFTWLESAKSDVGRARGVEHFRLFADEHWRPILPRGEVYSTELTERGWRSASQVLEEDGVAILSTVDPT